MSSKDKPVQESNVHSIDGIVMADAQGNITSYNRYFLELWEIPEDIFNSINSARALEYMFDRLTDSEEFRNSINVLSERKDLIKQEEIKLKDGRILDVYTSPILSPSGIYSGRIWHFRDISKQKQSEQKLRESEEKFRSMVENMVLNEERLKQITESSGVCVWEVDTNGLYTYVSPMLKNILGYTPADLIGKKHFYDFFPPELKEGLKNTAFGVFAQKESFQNFENPNIHKNGKLVILETTGVPMLDENGNLTGYRGADKDITARKHMVTELVTSKEKAEESDRLKSAFLTNMSHEIRTPMNSIVGFSNLLIDAESPEKEKYISLINKNSNQLLNIIDDVVFASRLQSEKYQVKNNEFNPAEMLTQLFRSVNSPGKENGFEAKLNIPEKLMNLTIRSDVDKISQVLNILASNAVKYTFDGEIEVGLLEQNGEIEFYISDTGIGIPENEQEHIFKSFFRGSKAISSVIGGTGLGLNIAKGLIDLIGGKIGFTSQQDKGSRFFFTLPAIVPEKTNTEEIGIHLKTRDLKDCSILIAEDESDSFLYLNVLLRNKAKVVDRAKNGQEVIDMISGKNYDLVFMDLKMPQLGGIEATQKIRENYPSIPIIAQTAYATFEEKERALAAGCNDYLTKPIRKDDLFAMVDKYYTNRCL